MTVPENFISQREVILHVGGGIRDAIARAFGVRAEAILELELEKDAQRFGYLVHHLRVEVPAR